jgi:hypothetical protein
LATFDVSQLSVPYLEEVKVTPSEKPMPTVVIIPEKP